MYLNVSRCHQMSTQKFSKIFFVYFYIKNFATFKFLSIANFFPKGSLNFLTPDLESSIKSSAIKGGQIPKNVILSSS